MCTVLVGQILAGQGNDGPELQDGTGTGLNHRRAARGPRGETANRLGAGDEPVTHDVAVSGGSGLVDGVRPVRGDGSRGGSVSAPQQRPGPVTSVTTEENVAALEDTAMMARFVRDYLGLLDERVNAITCQLESGNDLSAHISMLSLESTSSMVGAKELAKIVGLLRGAIERGQRSTVAALVTAMTAEAARVHDWLASPPDACCSA